MNAGTSYVEHKTFLSLEIVHRHEQQVVSSVAISAEISLRSPRKLYIFIINEKIYIRAKDQSIQKIFNLILTKTSLVVNETDTALP